MNHNRGTVTSKISNGIEKSGASKQAACLECRRSKIKCVRAQEAAICQKCESSGSSCVIPEFHVGRYKGVKNKRSGLEKAIHQVEEAIKKARTSDADFSHQQTEALQKLLSASNETHTLPQPSTVNDGEEATPRQAQRSLNVTQSEQSVAENTRHVSFAPEATNTDEVIVNAGNPLELLAIASAIPEHAPSLNTPSTSGRISQNDATAGVLEQDEAQAFFSSVSSRLDVSSDLDPVELGLITEEEAHELFEYFHNELAHTRWGLHPSIHTAVFVRSRSAFLFTSVLAASALFLADKAALSKRLSNHVKHLAHQIVLKRFRSVEIVLAFMVNIPWMTAGSNWASDDYTCYYLSTALTIALDLAMNKTIHPSPDVHPSNLADRLPRSDCIDARKALDIDGWDNVDPLSIEGRQLLRIRQRAYLALFNLDRGVCLARGRPWTVPPTSLIDNCDTWHNSELAIEQDGSLIASTALRRDFSGLVSSVRAMSDNNQLNVTGDPTAVKILKGTIEDFFNQWYTTWGYQIQQQDGSMPPYVEILVSHGKLSAYCSVINHSTVPGDVKQFFRAAGLASALNVMRVAVQGEARMKSMPNNTVIMVSFAACFVLGLSTTKIGDQIVLPPNVRKSVAETAGVLERIGSHPDHRKGASSLFGRHIKRILRVHVASVEDNIFTVPRPPNTVQTNPETYALPSSSSQISSSHLPSTDVVQENFPAFDMMTDDQLIEVIQNAKDDIESFNAGIQLDDGLFTDWLDMTW